MGEEGEGRATHAPKFFQHSLLLLSWVPPALSGESSFPSCGYTYVYCRARGKAFCPQKGGGEGREGETSSFSSLPPFFGGGGRSRGTIFHPEEEEEGQRLLFSDSLFSLPLLLLPRTPPCPSVCIPRRERGVDGERVLSLPLSSSSLFLNLKRG